MYSTNDALRKKANSRMISSEDIQAADLSHRHNISEIDGVDNLSTQTLNVSGSIHCGSQDCYYNLTTNNGNLLIKSNDKTIAEYDSEANDWKFGEIYLNELNNKIIEMDSIIENHYELLAKLKQTLNESKLICLKPLNNDS